MKKIKNKKKSGFTLVEILVYIGILSVLVLAVSSFILWSVRSNAKTKAIRKTMNDARRAMEIMSYEIKEAIGIYTPTCSSSQLSLGTSKYLATGEQTSYIDFFICDQKLCLKKESQVPVALTSNETEIDNLTFTQIGVDFSSIKIDLTMNYKNPQNRSELEASVSLSSTVGIRPY